MDNLKLILYTLTFLVFCSCDKEVSNELNEGDFLIFGHFYGECIGEGCVETYKLTSSKVYEDTNDNYLETDFSFIKLGNDKFKEVKYLIDFLPNELLESDEDNFGCPDCLDQGGLFIQYSKNGNIKSWRIDQSKSAVPNYLHEFMDEVNEKIDWINN